MHQDLQKIIDIIQQSQHLSDVEKSVLTKSAKDADKALEIANFKLDRTEKVKRTTAILLEETIAELEQKRKAVEEQNRELEVEGALERVRSVAMGMNKPDDLLNICEVLFKELHALGFAELRNTLINILNDEKSSFVNYDYSDEIGKSKTTVNYKAHPFIERQLKKIKSANDAFSETILTGEELKEWIEARRRNGEQDDPRLENAESLYYYFYSIGVGAIGISTINAVDNEKLNLLKRFRNVFNLSYQRYIDITNAEAQAREAQIQLGLERARAQSMMMQHSKELDDTLRVFHEQVLLLGINSAFSFLWLPDEERVRHIFWAAWQENNSKVFKSKSIDYPLDRNEPATAQCLVDWRGKDTVVSYHVPASGVESYFAAWQELIAGVEHLKKENFSHGLFYVEAFMKYGCFGVMVLNELTEDEKKILYRFAIEFERAYTRFLDLQKAEAQTRESQIQLALERVRARTMAMQKSDELAEAASLLFQQVKSLGLETFSSGFTVWENKDLVSWMCNADGSMNPPFRMPVKDEPWHVQQYQSWKKGEDFIVNVLAGERMQTYFRYLRSFPLLDDAFKKSEVAGHPMPKRQVHNVANFSNGNLLFITYEQVPDAYEIFKRFAKVFEQTYTRFLDLQKAETQAREAQIEAALERVRSRSLAMHKSGELEDVIMVISDQLVSLGFRFHNASFVRYNEKKGLNFWLSSPGQPQPYLIQVPYLDNPVFNRPLKAIEEGADFIADIITPKENHEWIKHLIEKSAHNIVSEKDKNYLLQTEGYARSVVITKNILLVIGNYASVPYTPEQNVILKRFGNVFEQAHTRFLDLQKAEAQAREAQIEIGLERVRSRAMAMQTSEELNELIGTVFTELTKLDLILTRSIIWVFDPATNAARWWMANIETPSHPMNFFIKYHEHPAYLRFVEAWKKQNVKFVYDLKGKDKIEWDNILFNETELKNLPDVVKNGMRAPERVILSGSFNNFGGINVASLESLSDEHFDILLRFAKVFDLTYTRFLDLQKAEAQAREAQIQLALERARAQSMMMQHSYELEHVSNVFHEQLQLLGIPSAFSYLWLLKEEKAEQTFWASWSEEKGGITEYKSREITYPLDKTNPYIAQCLIQWKSDETHPHLSVVPPEGVKTYFETWTELFRDVKSLRPEAFPDGLCYADAYMKYGSFGVVMSRDLTEEEYNILRRFSIEFERAYTRFLDLQKAEAQAREAQIEAALEKVRSRSLAMHKSDELNYVVKVLFERLKELQIPVTAVGIHLFKEGSKDLSVYVCGDIGSGLTINNYLLPYFSHPIANDLYDVYEKGLEYFVGNYSPEEKNSFYTHVFANTSLYALPDEIKNMILQSRFYSITMVPVNHSVISVNDFEGHPMTDGEVDILKRFANVFDQAYVRFLDLQKAEAQAREAKIEAALERIRSRSLAMHKSDELKEVIAVVFDNLNELNVSQGSVAIWLFDERTLNCDFWVATPLHQPEKVNLPYDKELMKENTSYKDSWKAFRSGKSYFNKGYDKQQKDKYFNYVFSHNDLATIPPATRDLILKSDKHSTNLVVEKHSTLFFDSWNGVTYNEESVGIFKRISRVFEQAYVRFLDLQKAEAQAREAQIEAAMERVRASAMAMHNSEGILEVVQVLREQIAILGEKKLESILVHIYHPETNQFDAWYAYRNPEYEDRKIESGKITLSWIQTARARKDQEKYFGNKSDYTIEADKEMLREWYAYLLTVVPNVVELNDKGEIIVPDILYYNYSKIPGGALMLITNNEASEQSKNLLKRAAQVFALAYSRFLDLQKAEAQAREAKIEAALEKVRSRTMAMQKSDELAETSAVLFKQLIDLGIAPNRLYICIVKDKNGDAEFWITDEDGSKISMAYEDNLNNNPSFKKMFDGWMQRVKSHVLDMKDDELQEYFKYLTSIHVPFKGGLAQQRRIQYLAYFSKGFIGMASPELQPAETLQLLERFAAVFNLTYTRFNDLKVAEAHAVQAEQDLIEIKNARKKAEDALTELQSTQRQLIQSEKMASLGELTAGIAHEIQNPLNFVNNFSEVSNELIDEMNEEITKGNLDDAKEIANDLKQNLEKINHHGKRAGDIVKGMLQHSRSSTGQKELTDINALADEYLRLAYHGLRAKDKGFNAKFETEFDASIPKISVVPQDIGRVILNLINNAFYAASQPSKGGLSDSESNKIPTVWVSTKKAGNNVLVSVKDNGPGIPDAIKDKIFQPFFTTKPTGQGTGLGLSLSYDIVKAHGGEIKVETKEGVGTEFVILL